MLNPSGVFRYIGLIFPINYSIIKNRGVEYAFLQHEKYL